MKWVVLTTAPDQLTAEMWREMLERAGIPAQVRPGDVTTFLGPSSFPCRLLVPDHRQEEARELLGIGAGSGDETCPG